VPPQLHARAGAAEVAGAVPLPALHAVPPERADARARLAASVGAGAGGPARRLRSLRARVQLRGDAPAPRRA